MIIRSIAPLTRRYAPTFPQRGEVKGIPQINHPTPAPRRQNLA